MIEKLNREELLALSRTKLLEALVKLDPDANPKTTDGKGVLTDMILEARMRGTGDEPDANESTDVAGELSDDPEAFAQTEDEGEQEDERVAGLEEQMDEIKRQNAELVALLKEKGVTAVPSGGVNATSPSKNVKIPNADRLRTMKGDRIDGQKYAVIIYPNGKRNDDVFIGVNGFMTQIQRGKEVTLDECQVDVLRNNERIDQEQDENGHLVPIEVRDYEFTARPL